MTTRTLYPAETNGNVVTSWVPLTTAWPSVRGCSDSMMWEGDRLVAYDPGYGIVVDTKVRCQPPAVTTWWNQNRLGGGYSSDYTAVSIGPLICPDGYSTVATSVKSQISTHAMCCPPGYDLVNGVPGSIVGDCISTASPGTTLTYASAPPTNTNAYTITTTSISDYTTIGAIAVVGWNINAVQQGSTAVSGTTSTPSSASSTASIPSSTSSSKPSSGLSTGAKAGIGVGAGLGVIGLLALLAAILLYRRRKAKPSISRQTISEAPAYLSPHERLMWQYNVELDGKQVHGKPNAQRPLEPLPVELDTNRG